MSRKPILDSPLVNKKWCRKPNGLRGIEGHVSAEHQSLGSTPWLHSPYRACTTLNWRSNMWCPLRPWRRVSTVAQYPGPPECAKFQFACHSDLLGAVASKLEFFRIRTTAPPSSKETSSISVFMNTARRMQSTPAVRYTDRRR